jgi:hypothetical protein
VRNRSRDPYPRETQEMMFDAPRAGLCVLQGDLRTRHLRQHKDGGGDARVVPLHKKQDDHNDKDG